MLESIRMAADDDATIEGWAVPFSGSFNDGVDSYGTRFSARTEFRLDWYPERPLLYHHGLDKDVGLDPVGTVRSMEVRDKGVWMQAQLDKQSEYFEAIRELVKNGKMFLSSGSVEHLVGINQRTGHVDRWPIVEQTLTTTPSNLLADIPVHSFRAAIDIALPDDLTDDAVIVHSPLRAVWTSKYIDSLPNGSFAYVEPGAGTDKSKRHLPYKDKNGKPDAAHVRNALARLDQTDIPASAKASAKRKLLAAAKTLGIESKDAPATKSADVETIIVNGIAYTPENIYRGTPGIRAEVNDDSSDDDVGTDERSFEDICSDLDRLLNPMYAGAWTQRLNTFPTHVIVRRCEPTTMGYGYDEDDGATYWDIPYSLNADQEPVLGAPTQVERNETFTPVVRAADFIPTLDAQLVIRHADAFARSTKDYGERRFREGRMLSAANLKTISDTADGLEAHAKSLRDLHHRAAGDVEDAARAALFTDPEYVRVRLKLMELAAAL